jgi:protein TonB
MSAPVIFRSLPATFPDKDKYRKPSVISSLVFHGVLILLVVLVPLLAPQSLSRQALLVSLVSPLAPPAPAPPPLAPAPLPKAAPPKAVKPVDRPVVPEALVVPAAIPRDVVRVIDAPAGGELIGALGDDRLPEGMPGGILGGFLSSNSNANIPPAMAAPAPPPPPPPPPVAAAKPAAPTGPVRVGGMVKEPRAVKMVPPRYPTLASRARVGGMVTLEATLTADGTVSEIRVISGHPLLVDAAVECVKQWRYEPTLLNGTPVAIILTAKVNFERARHS